LRSKIFIFLLLFGTLGLISQSDVFQNNSHSAERSKRTVQADTTHTDIAKVPRPQVGNKKKLANLKESADSASTDTISADSIKKSKSMLDEPVTYTAKDSMTYDAATGLAHLYGEAQVNYQNLQLNSDEIVMCMDSSIVHAYGRPDSTGTIVGKPVFKQGSDEYKSDQMDYNFKTHKGFINQVKTKEGDGFLTSESSKRNSAGELFVEHGRYTTCDAEHPHFYIALSRAKVRPGKDVVFGPAYLVVEDVPLPLAVPYGFFPFSKRYSSGFIMPTYGDETVRGFYLRDGGYYFAINDNIDLKLTEKSTQRDHGDSTPSRITINDTVIRATFTSAIC
jgi:lipopolysaccharide assembly outer membrane protein LptD (OstA)